MFPNILEGLLLDPANSFLVQLGSKAPPNPKVKEAQGNFSEDFPMCFNGKTQESTRPTKTFPANSHPFLSQATLLGRYYQTDPVWARGNFGAAKSSCCKLFFCKCFIAKCFSIHFLPPIRKRETWKMRTSN